MGRTSLINVLERAAELEALAEDEAADRLSQKIAEARSQYLRAA